MKTFAFKNRLFLVYSIVIAVVVVLFTVVLLATTMGMNRQTELYHQTELYNKNLDQVENLLWQMDRLASQVISSNEILSSFIPLASDADSGNYFAQNLIDGIRIGSLLSDINGTDKFAARISVFGGGGDYVSTGTLYELPTSIEAALAGGHYDAIMARIAQEGDTGLLIDFHSDTWSGNPNLQLMSLYRVLSSYAPKAYGVVEIQVRTDALAAFPFWHSEGSEYYLVDRQGNIEYPLAGEGNAAQRFPALPMRAPMDSGDVMILEERIDDRSVLLMCARILPSDWLLVRVLPAGALLAPYARNMLLIGLACALLLCCLLLVMYYLASRIAGPLQSFSRRIADVNLNSMQQSISEMEAPYSIAELDTLRRSFHAMLSRLDKSISMEMQAHMRALQSQMNPHFLFNMLSVIIESSEEGGDARTVSMCLKLSAMLRYVADFSIDRATLAEELAHARNYLDLMKDRYEALFTYEIVIDGDVAGVPVPKMIVQPLAENCFSHGFRECKPPWHVRIEAVVSEGRWRLRVIDNGSGIAEETVRMIHQRVEAYRSDMAANYRNLRLGGMGLVNTLLRLSLPQKEQVAFSIENSPERGMIIEVGGSIHDSRADR